MNKENVKENQAIKLESFIINKASFQRKIDVAFSEGVLQIKPQFSRGIQEIEKDKYRIILGVRIAEDTDETALPFDVEVEISGVFRLNGIEEENKQAVLEHKACSIIFPYLRSTVSSVMAVAGVNPIILPVININAIFD